MNSAAKQARSAAVLLGLVACSATSPSTSAGAPVPDPGGPFAAGLEPNQPLGQLSTTETDTLCRAIATANYAYLTGAVETAVFCAMVSMDVSHDSASHSDGGVDAGALCGADYQDCLHTEPPIIPFECPLPIPGQWPRPCDATVEDLSACINEIAANDPVSSCLTAPPCATDMIAQRDSATPFSGPACDRLYRICPSLNRRPLTFPC